MRARWARHSLWPARFEHLPLPAQQAACRAFLRKLGQRYLAPASVVSRLAPFSHHLAHRARAPDESDDEPDGGPQQRQPLDFSRRQRQAPLYTFTPLCMHHTGRKQGERPYLRLSMTGRRSGLRSPTKEYAHRVVCWIFHGPPPSDPQLLKHPNRGRWHGSNWVVGHLCGDETCVCPPHLAWLRPVDNKACQLWHARHRKGHWHLWPGRRQ